jgi:hypothetical protein
LIIEKGLTTMMLQGLEKKSDVNCGDIILVKAISG